MIYKNHPVYDLHDTHNALFLNRNIDYYSSISLCIFFIPGINTMCSKIQSNWLIFNKIYFSFNYNLINII